MLILQIKFDQCPDPKAALAAIRVQQHQCGLRLQGDRLHIPAASDRIIRIGRSWSCEVYLLDADAAAGGLAREHLQIELTSQLCFVRDLATKNGTLLNGKWLGGPPAPHRSPASRVPSGRKAIKVGDVIQMPGITLTVLEVPGSRPCPVRPASAPSPLPNQPGPPAPNPASPTIDPGALRLPALVAFQPAESPILPPDLKGFKFTATLGGKPASGLTYLYERKLKPGAVREKWVVKYVGLGKSDDLDSLRQLLAAYFGVPHAGLRQPCAYSLAPSSYPTHLALCFPQLKGVHPARSPRLDLAGIHDLLGGTLGALAALHERGLAHGHVCARNIFLEAAGHLALTDTGMNSLRLLLGAELTGPTPSASNDLIALGNLCLDLLGESAIAPQRPPGEPPREPQPDWPGAPLQALARRLRHDSQLTAAQALKWLHEAPRPQVSRLLTATQWRHLRDGTNPE